MDLTLKNEYTNAETFKFLEQTVGKAEINKRKKFLGIYIEWVELNTC